MLHRFSNRAWLAISIALGALTPPAQAAPAKPADTTASALLLASCGAFSTGSAST